MNKVCFFKKHGIKTIDYKDTDVLRKFLNPQGKIMPRKRTGCTAKSQNQLEKAVKRARYMALIPYIEE